MQSSQRSSEPVHKVLIRCLGDLDDLLDTVHDPASFAAVKPKILSRMRRTEQNSDMEKTGKVWRKEFGK